MVREGIRRLWGYDTDEGTRCGYSSVLLCVDRRWTGSGRLCVHFGNSGPGVGTSGAYIAFDGVWEHQATRGLDGRGASLLLPLFILFDVPMRNCRAQRATKIRAFFFLHFLLMNASYNANTPFPFSSLFSDTVHLGFDNICIRTAADASTTPSSREVSTRSQVTAWPALPRRQHPSQRRTHAAAHAP